MKSSRSETARDITSGLRWPCIGLESEFELWDGHRKVAPETVFSSPQQFIRTPLVHRTGRSYHLPTGGAVYFDTGVLEVTTPVIELGPGAASRATRNLWEGIQFVRDELDAWKGGSGRRFRLVGFSTHYSVSYDVPPAGQLEGRTLADLAWILAHVLPVPVMLMGTNRRSTGVGVRPRENRVEVTADFVPDPHLMTATAAVLIAIIRETMSWPSYAMSQLGPQGVPVPRDLRPGKHTSRKGWLASVDSWQRNPFQVDPGERCWPVASGDRTATVSLRGLARRIIDRYSEALSRHADPAEIRLIRALLTGRRLGMLDLDDRPASYDDVGRDVRWAPLPGQRNLTHSRYEAVVRRAMAPEPVVVGGQSLRPRGLRGWTEVAFRDQGGRVRAIGLDELISLMAETRD